MPALSLAVGALLYASPIHSASVPAAPPIQRYPALWVINDSDTVIYLFGTFHALDERSDWFGQAVMTAFLASDELVLETLVPKVAATGAPSGNGEPQAAARGQDSSQTFLATTRQVMDAGRSTGLSTAFGADAVLRAAADSAGKRVGGLESFQFQMRMYSALPRPVQPVQADPQVTQALASVLADLRTAWGRGDLDRFAPMLMHVRNQSPQVYRTMFLERNSRWAHWIAERLKSPGTVFVAVGAGHLSGPDSVQNQLAGLGVRSARVN